MEQVFSAELVNNEIHWLNEKPKRLYKNSIYYIKVIIEQKAVKVRTGKDLVDFFRNSPLFDVELDLTRENDYGRDIEL